MRRQLLRTIIARWRDESENPNRPWSETNSGDLDGTMKQTFPSMTSFNIEKFNDSNVKLMHPLNGITGIQNSLNLVKIFTDAFKQKFPEGEE